MSSAVIYGLILSLLGALFLIVLFRFEKKRGERFGEKMRRHADFFVLKALHATRIGLRSVGSSALRQTFHYVFHTVLSVILKGIKYWEDGLRNAIRSNKTVARNAEQQSTTLSKLEEIALHKVASALTEDEKKAHKEKTLQGF